MKQRRHTPEQVIRKLAEAEALRLMLVAQDKKRYNAAEEAKADRDAAAYRAMLGRV